jgi:hypothetical protein
VAYVLVVIVLVAVAGVVAYAVMRARPERGRERGDVDVTPTDVTPPAHPTAPVPGSDERRRRQGKP